MNHNQHDRLCKTYWNLWERVRDDPEYARLRSELEALEPGYESILAALPEQDRKTLDHYITLRETMDRRMIEFVCESFAR